MWVGCCAESVGSARGKFVKALGRDLIPTAILAAMVSCLGQTGCREVPDKGFALSAPLREVLDAHPAEALHAPLMSFGQVVSALELAPESELMGGCGRATKWLADTVEEIRVALETPSDGAPWPDCVSVEPAGEDQWQVSWLECAPGGSMPLLVGGVGTLETGTSGATFVSQGWSEGVDGLIVSGLDETWVGEVPFGLHLEWAHPSGSEEHPLAELRFAVVQNAVGVRETVADSLSVDWSSGDIVVSTPSPEQGVYVTAMTSEGAVESVLAYGGSFEDEGLVRTAMVEGQVYVEEGGALTPYLWTAELVYDGEVHSQSSVARAEHDPQGLGLFEVILSLERRDAWTWSRSGTANLAVRGTDVVSELGSADASVEVAIGDRAVTVSGKGEFVLNRGEVGSQSGEWLLGDVELPRTAALRPLPEGGDLKWTSEEGDTRLAVRRFYGRGSPVHGRQRVHMDVTQGTRSVVDEWVCRKDAFEETPAVQVRTPAGAQAECVEVEVSVGQAHACAVRHGDDATVHCWGEGSWGQLGHGRSGREGGDNVFRSRPVAVLDAMGARLSGVDQVTAGGQHTCALRQDGRVWCWGRAAQGRLGTAASAGAALSAHAIPLEGVDRVSRVVAGNRHTCVLAEQGRVGCWGANESGQLGDGTSIDRSTVAWVPGIEAIEVAAGQAHTCAVARSGEVWCWGANALGQAGAAGILSVGLPHRVEDEAGEPVQGTRSLDAEGDRTCAVDGHGVTRCWGDNAYSALGVPSDGSGDAWPTAQIVANGLGEALGEGHDVAVGRFHGCLVRQQDQVSCWGHNNKGQVGDGTVSAEAHGVHPPVSVTGLPPVERLDGGYGTTCAATHSGAVWCWGDDEWGQVGDGDPREVSPVQPTPIEVVGFSGR